MVLLKNRPKKYRSRFSTSYNTMIRFMIDYHVWAQTICIHLLLILIGRDDTCDQSVFIGYLWFWMIFRVLCMWFILRGISALNILKRLKNKFLTQIHFCERHNYWYNAYRRVYIIKWYETLADPTIIIGGTGRFIIRLRTFFGILEFYAWAFIFIIVPNSARD